MMQLVMWFQHGATHEGATLSLLDQNHFFLEGWNTWTLHLMRVHIISMVFLKSWAV